MNALIRFEIKKILSKRLNQVVLVFCTILTTLFFIFPIFQYSSYNEQGESLKGLAAIQANKGMQERLAGDLTEQRVKQDIEAYQQLFSQPDNVYENDGMVHLEGSVYVANVSPRYKYLSILNEVLSPLNARDYYLTTIQKLPLDQSISFDEKRQKKIEQLVETGFEDRKLSEKEQAYWLDKNNDVSKPLTYGYYEGWYTIINNFELMIFVILAIIICVAPIFASEYQSGADQIILTTKYGKSKLIVAKAVAVYSVAFIVLTIQLIVGFGLVFSVFGLDGWALPVQLIHPTIPYAWTMLQAVMMQTVVLYVLMFGLVSVTMLLSASIKSSFAVLIVMITILLLPMFLGQSDSNAMWNKIYILLPYPSLLKYSGFDTNVYVSYSFFGKVIDVYFMRFASYIVVGVISIAIAFRNFKQHQVG